MIMTNGQTRCSHIYKVLQGDLVENAETAIDLAAVLIRRNWSEDTLKVQQPLVAREEGDTWLVEGTPKTTPAPGELLVHVQLKKSDASVVCLHWTLQNPLDGAKR
jgi:hypothetical protein